MDIDMLLRIIGEKEVIIIMQQENLKEKDAKIEELKRCIANLEREQFHPGMK
jgi:polyhydroxyalkanoate synthesis regulator phasin